MRLSPLASGTSFTTSSCGSSSAGRGRCRTGIATGTNPVSAASAYFQVRQIPVLLGGDPEALKEWAAGRETGRMLGYAAVIFAGAGLYGAAMGYWRSPLQAGYNLLKFPLV